MNHREPPPLSDTTRQQLNELCWQLREGKLTTAQAEQLEALVREHAAAREFFVRFHYLTADLEWMFGSTKGEAESSVAVGKLPPVPILPKAVFSVLHFFARPTPLSLSVAAMVLVTLMVILGLFAPPVYQCWAHRPTNEAIPNYQVVAQMIGTENVVWRDAETTLAVGQRLSSGTNLELKSGLVEIRFVSGARAIIEGPAIFTLESPNACRLARGRLLAKVPRRAVGFSVLTNACQIIDLGTEFGVSTSQLAETEVHVLRGEVEVAAGKLRQRVTAGHGLRIAQGAVQPTSMPATAFRRSISPSSRAVEISWQPAQVLTSASDLLSAGEPVFAMNAGGSEVSVNGITFTPGTPFAQTFAVGAMNGHTTGDAKLDKLLDNFSFGGGTNSAVRLDGLEVGARYQVQAIYCDGRPSSVGRAMRFSAGPNQPWVELPSQPITQDAPPFGQFAIGTFVAHDSTQLLHISAVNAVNVHLNALIVRKIHSSTRETKSRQKRSS